jgi:hypothetical protein
MTALKLDKFGGGLPAWDDRLLPEGQASYALNTYLFSGALIGWRQPKLLHQFRDSTSKYTYRIPNRDSNNTLITAQDGFWMEFADADTTVMRTPVVNDTYQRYYFASPSDLPKYNTYDRIINGDPPFILGIPASGCTPGVTVTGGGDTSQLGYQTVTPTGGGLDYRPGNQIMLVPIIPDGSMLITQVVIIPQSTDPSMVYQAVCYSDLNGKPFRLIGIGNELTGFSAGSGVGAPFNNGVSVISDTTYWIGIAYSSAFYATIADGSIVNGTYYDNTYSNKPISEMNPNFVSTGPTWQMWADLIGQSIFEARAYLYTWVTEYGEEGPPSPPAIVDGWSNATWTVDLFQPTPEVMANRNITKMRIYRSITSQQGQGTYFFVAEVPITQAQYVDTSEDNIVSLSSQLESLYWYAPPEDLQGIVPFPNGIAIGWRENEIWFSEVYRPHAWPPNYVLTTEFPVVGIGVCGQSIIVCTQGSPYLVVGVHPSAMSMMKINLPEPCLHRGSIVSTDTTVLYVSQNGLIQISSSGQGSNVTEGWISRERWQALTPQKHIRAIKHATSYFAFGSVAGDDVSVARQGYTIELSNEDQVSFTIWPQAGNHRLGFSQLSAPNGFDIVNVLCDPWTGTGLLVQNGGVWYYDFTDLAPTIVPYKWRSKVYQQLSAKNFSAVKAWFTVPPSTPPQVDRNTAEPQPALGPNQYGILRVYADGQLYTTREIRKSGELLRIYSGIKAEAWQFEIEGRVNLSNLQIATSAKELGLV